MFFLIKRFLFGKSKEKKSKTKVIKKGFKHVNYKVKQVLIFAIKQ